MRRRLFPWVFTHRPRQATKLAQIRVILLSFKSKDSQQQQFPREKENSPAVLVSQSSLQSSLHSTKRTAEDVHLCFTHFHLPPIHAKCNILKTSHEHCWHRTSAQYIHVRQHISHQTKHSLFSELKLSHILLGIQPCGGYLLQISKAFSGSLGSISWKRGRSDRRLRWLKPTLSSVFSTSSNKILFPNGVKCSPSLHDITKLSAAFGQEVTLY